MKIKSITIRERATGTLLEQRTYAEPRIEPLRPLLPPVQTNSGATAGLGDRVEKIAQPIARAIDRVFGTKLASCGGCKKRREWLNRFGR